MLADCRPRPCFAFGTRCAFCSCFALGACWAFEGFASDAASSEGGVTPPGHAAAAAAASALRSRKRRMLAFGAFCALGPLPDPMDAGDLFVRVHRMCLLMSLLLRVSRIETLRFA